MTALNRWVSEHVVKASAAQNEEGEKVGLINRAFSAINHAREAGQRMKKANYRAYYALKYTVFALIAVAIVASVFV
jgi:beta-hydroxylase